MMTHRKKQSHFNTLDDEPNYNSDDQQGRTDYDDNYQDQHTQHPDNRNNQQQRNNRKNQQQRYINNNKHQQNDNQLLPLSIFHIIFRL